MRTRAFPIAALLIAAGWVAAPLPAAAFGSNSPSNPTTVRTTTDYETGRQAVDAKDWSRAVSALKRAVDKDPRNADAFNLLGYAERHAGDLNAAFASYGKALALDPKHRGAHEYVGEAYLEAGNLAKAEEHLKALSTLCPSGCEELGELKEKIDAFKMRPKG